MEILILNQDKDELVVARHLKIDTDDCSISAFDSINEEYGRIVGTYATPERCKEVLRAVVVSLSLKCSVFEMPEK